MNDLISEWRQSHPNSPLSDAELINQFGSLQDQDNRFSQYPSFLSDWAAQKKAYAAATAPSVAQDFASGAAQGADSLLSTGQAALAAGSAAVGAGGARDYWLEKAQANEAAAAKSQPSVPNFSDVHDPDSFLHWLGGASGQLLPNVAEMTATGAIGLAGGASAGTAVDPGAGTIAGGVSGLVAGVTERAAVRSLMEQFASGGLEATLAAEPKIGATTAKLVADQIGELSTRGAVRNIAPETEALLTQQSKAIGANYGNHIAQGINFYAQSAGSIYSDLTKNKNVDPDAAVNTALLGGFAASLPAQFLPSYVGSKLFAGVKGAALDEAKTGFYGYLTRTVQEAPKTIAGGIASMDMQQLATTAAEKYATGQPWTPDDWKSLENTSATGLLMGAVAAPMAAFGGGGSRPSTEMGTPADGSTPPPPIDPQVLKSVNLDPTTPEGFSTLQSLTETARQDLAGTLPAATKNAMGGWSPETKTQYQLVKGILQDANAKSEVQNPPAAFLAPPAAGNSSPAGPPETTASPTPAGGDGGLQPNAATIPSTENANDANSGPSGTPALDAASAPIVAGSASPAAPAETPVLEAPTTVPKSALEKIASNAAKLKAASVASITVEESPKKPIKPQKAAPVATPDELAAAHETALAPAAPATSSLETPLLPPSEQSKPTGNETPQLAPQPSESAGNEPAMTTPLVPSVSSEEPLNAREAALKAAGKPWLAAPSEHPLLSQLGIDSLQPGEGASARGRGKGATQVATTPPFADIPAGMSEIPAMRGQLGDRLTSGASTGQGKKTDTNRATALLAPDGTVHVVPTYKTTSARDGTTIRIAPIPGEESVKTLDEALKKGYSPISSIYLKDSVNALDPKATHSFPTQEAYERQIAAPARERLAAAKSTAAAVESHITGNRGAVGGTASMGEGTQQPFERPEFSDELGGALHTALESGKTPEGAIEHIALNGTSEEKTDLRNLITQLVEHGHSQKDAINYVTSEVERANQGRGTRAQFVKTLSEPREDGAAHRPSERPLDADLGDQGNRALPPANAPESAQPKSPVENPVGEPGQEGKAGNEKPDSSGPRLIGNAAKRRINTLADKKKLTIADLRDPQKGIHSAVQSDPQAALEYVREQAAMEWGDKNYKHNFTKIAAHIEKEWPTAGKNQETITPSEDTPTGQNAAGEKLYERKDGSRYRMVTDRADRPNGYPDFGGDLAPVESAPKTVGEAQDAWRAKYVQPLSEMFSGTGIHFTTNVLDMDRNLQEKAESVGIKGEHSTGQLMAKLVGKDASDLYRKMLSDPYPHPFTSADTKLPDVRQSTTAPTELPSTPSTQSSYAHVVQTLTQAGVPVEVHQQLFGALVHDLAASDRRPVASGGGVYDRAAKTVSVVLSDAAKPTSEDFRTLIEEAGHHVFASMSGTEQNQISAAISGLTDAELGVRNYTKSANPNIQAEERLMAAVSRRLADSGFNPIHADTMAQAMVRFVKDLYYKASMALQRAILGKDYTNGDIAAKYFQNRLESFLSRDQNTLSWIDRLGATKVDQSQKGLWRNPGVSPLFETLSSDGRHPTYDHIPDDSIAAARFNNENLRFSTTPSPDEPTRQTEVEMRAALFNHAGGIVDRAAKLPAVMEEAKARGVDAGSLIRNAFNLPAAKDLLGTLGDIKETDGSPVKFDPAKQISDFKAKSNIDPLTIKAAANTYDTLGKIVRTAASDRDDIVRLQSAKDSRIEALDLKQRDYLSKDGATREMVNWTRAAVNDVYSAAKGQSRRLGAVEQQLRSLDPTASIKDYAAAFKNLHSGDQLKGDNLFNLLEKMALDKTLDLRKPITEIYGDMQHNLEYRDWLDRSKESKAVIATAVAFAKTHAATMADIERRRMTNMDERANITKSLKDLTTEKAGASKDIGYLAKTAKLSERARAAYREEFNRVRSLSRQISDKETRIKLAEAIAPVYAKEYADLGNKLSLSGDFTLADGAKYNVPPSYDSTSEEVAANRKTLNLDTSRKLSNPVEVEQHIRDMRTWCFQREIAAAAGDADAKDIVYQTVKRQVDTIAAHKNFSLNPIASDKFLFELKLQGEATAVSEAYPSNAAKIIGRMDKIYTSEVGRYARSTEIEGRLNDQKEDALLALMPKKTANARQVLRQQILNPVRAMLQRQPDLEERYADQPEKLKNALIARAEKMLRANPATSQLIAGNEPAFMAGLRNLLEHQNKISRADAERAAHYHAVLDPSLKVVNPATGNEEAALRRHIPQGTFTFSQRLSSDIKLINYALRRTGWNSDETGESFASQAFQKISELYKGATKGAQNDAAMQQVDAIEAQYFHDPRHGDQITNHFVHDLVHTDLQSIWDAPSLDGVTKVPADPEKVRAAWNSANGSVRTFAENLYKSYTEERGEHTQSEGDYVGDVFQRLAGVSARVDKLNPYESGTTPNTLRGASPDALINARGVNDLPGNWFDYHSFDQKDRAQTSRALAFNAAYGRDGEAGQKMFDTVNAEVLDAKDRVEAAERAITRVNPQIKPKELAKLVDAKLGADAANVRKFVKNQRVVTDSEDGLAHLFRRDNSPDGTTRFLVRAASTLGNMMIAAPSSAIVNTSRLLDLQLKYGASNEMLAYTAHMGGEFAKEMAASLAQAIGHKIYSDGEYHKYFIQLFGGDPGSYQKFSDSFDALQGERLPAQVMRGVSDTMQLGMAKPGDEHTVFRPAHLFTTVGVGIDKVGTMELWRLADTHIARGVLFYKDNPAALNDPAFKLDSKVLGLKGRDANSFNRLMRDADNWGVNYDDAVRGAIQRNDGTTMTNVQRARLSSLFDSEIANEGNFTTMPAASYNNSILRACAPLLTWGFRRARQIMDLRLDPDGRNNMKALGYGVAGLAVMAGGGLALSGLLQQYYASITGKATNIRPIIGEPDARQEMLAVMENLNRIGTVGMFGDILNSAFGEGGGGDNRMVSVDNRVVAIQSLNNLFGAIQAWTNQGSADYIHVIRPVMTSIGGGALLQYMDIANNALGLDNLEARQTARVNAENYLRVVGRQMELDVRKPDGGGANPTPTSPALTEMELAAYLNNPSDFNDAWGEAVKEAKAEGREDPVDYIKRAFAARHPLRAVFKTPPSTEEYQDLLNNLPDSGRQDVSEAVKLFNHYGQKLGLKSYDGKSEQPTASTLSAKSTEPLTKSNPYALRQAAMAGMSQGSMF